MRVNTNLSDLYRKDIIKESKMMKEYIAWFDSFRVNPLLSYFTQQDIQYMHKLATSPAMHCNIKEFYYLLGELMKQRGFRIIGGGTNRRAFECVYDPRVVAKVATDKVGFISNLKEYPNQNVLKPFCNKICEVTPCGTLSVIEKFVPIKDESEFQKYSQEIFDILYFKIRNNNIAMDDIGTRSMKNWGYRDGFGPGLLDYPSMYVADPKKRLCKNILNGRLCSGTLDYDEGFNTIVCSECGKTYFASTIAKKDGDDLKSLLSAVGYYKNEGVKSMRIQIVNKETGEVVSTKECGGKSNHVDSTVSNIVIPGIITPAVSTTPVPKKKIRIEITPKEEPVEEKTGNITVDTEIVKPIVNTRNVTVIEEDVKQPVTTESFMEKFNRMNSGIDLISLKVYQSNNRAASILEFARAVNDMTISHPFMDEEKAYELYMQVSTATIKEQGTIDTRSVNHANTMVNEMLRKISNNDNGDMFAVFYKLINNVKNTIPFFNSIVNFWKTLVELVSFDTDETFDGNTYCIFTEVYDRYCDIVWKALEDYRYNIVYSGNFTYNIRNIINIINVGVSEINWISECTDEVISDTDDYVTIVASEFYTELSYCSSSIDEQCRCEATNSMESVEPEDLDETFEQTENDAEVLVVTTDNTGEVVTNAVVGTLVDPKLSDKEREERTNAWISGIKEPERFKPIPFDGDLEANPIYFDSVPNIPKEEKKSNKYIETVPFRGTNKQQNRYNGGRKKKRGKKH